MFTLSLFNAIVQPIPKQVANPLLGYTFLYWDLQNIETLASRQFADNEYGGFAGLNVTN